MTSPTVLGIIPTFNHLDYARRAGQSFLDHTPASAVVFVDDGSANWEQLRLDRGWAEPERIHLHRYPVNDGNLTRSWNFGLRLARQLGCRYAVVTNSDVLFPAGWWDCVAYALEHGVDLAAPLTNAPGHRPKQQVARHLDNYKVGDDLDYLAAAVQRLQARHGRKVHWPVASVNGFCLMARTEVWWANAWDAEHVFHPKFKLLKNEDELAGRWRTRGRMVAIVPGSLVFHYRGVTRGGAALRGVEGRGWFRQGGRPKPPPIKRRVVKPPPSRVVVIKVRRKERGKAKKKK